jgi:error-prone DNA polymerase
MQSLLRTRPENLDDLTVQVALVRPGPIQGKAVHPYVGTASSCARTRTTSPRTTTRGSRSRSRDVRRDRLPGAGAERRDGARRLQRGGGGRAAPRDEPQALEEALEAFRARFVEGALANGVDRETADKVYDKLTGFSGFGFPKSHAAAFGLLAYQSAWLRHYYPTEFLCSLLNAQPMGFYPPSTLVRDAQRKGVEVRPPDVNRSLAKCSNENGAVRMGIEYVTHVGEDDAARVVDERLRNGPYRDVRDLAQRTELGRDELEALVASGACDWPWREQTHAPLGARPRSARADGARIGRRGAPARAPARSDGRHAGARAAVRVGADARRLPADERLGRRAPARAASPHLPDGTLSTSVLREQQHKTRVAVAGMAIARQRPSTAKGIVFMLLEDEFGQVNLIVPPQVYDRHRARSSAASR